jgi:hypothetical protein
MSGDGEGAADEVDGDQLLVGLALLVACHVLQGQGGDLLVESQQAALEVGCLRESEAVVALRDRTQLPKFRGQGVLERLIAHQALVLLLGEGAFHLLAGDPLAGRRVGLGADLERLQPQAPHPFAGVATTALARRIIPTHTPYDGDVVFAVSTSEEFGQVDAARQLMLGTMAAEALSRAVERAVTV